MDFGPVEVCIQIQSIHQDAATNFHVGHLAPEGQIAQGPVGDPQIGRRLLLREETGGQYVRGLHGLPPGADVSRWIDCSATSWQSREEKALVVATTPTRRDQSWWSAVQV